MLMIRGNGVRKALKQKVGVDYRSLDRSDYISEAEAARATRSLGGLFIPALIIAHSPLYFIPQDQYESTCPLTCDA